MSTRSLSTNLRNLVIAVPGLPAVSSTITSTLRPAIWCPASSMYIAKPFSMSRPIWAAAPVSGARKPILIGLLDWAAAGARPAAPARRRAMPNRRRAASQGVGMVLSPSKGGRSVMAASLCRGRTGIQLGRGEDGLTGTRPDRLGRDLGPGLGGGEPRELPLHAVDPRQVTGHVVVAAPLAPGDAEAAPGEVVAGTRPAQVDDRGQVLLLTDGGGDDPAALQRAGDVAVEQGRGHLHRVARQHTHVERPEPAAVLDHHVVPHAIAPRLPEGRVGDLVHADRARRGPVHVERVPG